MSPEQFVVWSYVVYLVVSVATTIWVAHTLFKNGRPFLVDAFKGNADLADSVNHLLVVGFYLINLGYVTLALKYGDKPQSVQGMFEFISTKVGLVLLILGGMHFFNLHVFATIRQRGLTRDEKTATGTTPATTTSQLVERLRGAGPGPSSPGAHA